MAPSAPPKDVAKALDDALAAKHVAPDAVKKRSASPTSAWAVIDGQMNAAKELLSVDVIASRADGIAELHLEPPPGKTTIKEVESLDGKDLDGNGTDEGLLVIEWGRVTTVPGKQDDWATRSDEDGHQLYVLGGAAPSLHVAFTHLVSYESTSTALPEDNPTPVPADEAVTYEWNVAAGKPPTVSLKRTKSEIADKDRLKGMLDPASDPLFAAGSGKDIPLSGL